MEDNELIKDSISLNGEDTEESTAWSNDIKWNSKDGHAYLFMFDDNKAGYRPIRLAIYTE